MSQIPIRQIWTIGYGGRGRTELVDLLLKHDIQHLMDVREKPQTRIPGFSAGSLRKFLPDAGLAYSHVPELGNASRHDPEASAFRLVDEARGLDVLQSAANEWNVAVMCACRKWQDCHRLYVVDRLKERLTGLVVTHIP